MKIGVILSGSGYLDGAEIREAVLTLLALSKKNVQVKMMAPNIDQYHVVNHLTGEESSEKRNVLEEAARIARGDIQDIEKVNLEELDALIIPGGFGVAKNLSSFAFKGAQGEILPSIKKAIQYFHQQEKPIGTICIAPAVINLIIPANVTIGHDANTAAEIEKLGGHHTIAQATEIVIDEKNKIVSTPAYMEHAPLHEIAQGIERCVNAVLTLI